MIEKQCPEWKAANKHFVQNESTDRLKHYVSYMWKYFKDDKKNIGNPLVYAATNGHVDFAELLIETPIDFNATDHEGCTAIDHACRNNQLGILQLLIRHSEMKNINFELKGYNDWTSLHHACIYASLDLIKLLIDHLKSVQNNLFQLTNNGSNIFHLAVQNPNSNVPKYIYDQFKENIDINSSINDGTNPLQLVCLNGNLETLKFVLQQEPDLTAVNQYHNNYFHLAAMNPKTEVLQHLLNSYPTTLANVPGFNGRRYIHEAAHNGILGNVRLLHAHFGNEYFDEGDDNGNTPLHLASYKGHFKVVEFILKKSDPNTFNINKKNHAGSTAENFAKHKGHTSTSELLEIYRLESRLKILKAKYNIESNNETLK